MSSWRAHMGFNKYLSVAGRATRQALKEDIRVKIEQRTTSNLRYQHWENGKPGEQIWMKEQEEEKHHAG